MTAPLQDNSDLETELCQLSSFNPEVLLEAVTASNIEHVLLDTHEFQGNLLRVELGEYVFNSGEYTSSVYARGSMPTDHVTLGFAIARQNGGQLNGFKIDQLTPFIYSQGMELDTRLPAFTRWFGLQVPHKLLAEIGIRENEKIAGPVQCTSAQLARLHGVLLDSLNVFSSLTVNIQKESNRSQLVYSQFNGLIAAFAATLGEPQYSEEQFSRKYKTGVDQAISYMEANIDQPICFSELYAATGLNYKTLERAFHVIVGITPQRFLTMLRLSRARHMLISNKHESLKVSDIATSCGCFHLGRFSQTYRKLFHESPSETLNNRSF